MPQKLIIDTDIGTDVDDAYAVLFALASPETDLLALTLVHGNLDVRARIAAKLLKLAGRSDVPVFKGLPEPLVASRGIYWPGHEGRGIDLSGSDEVRVEDGAVARLIEFAREHGSELSIVSIGMMTNIAAAIGKAPEAMRSIRRLYVMASTFMGTGPENAAVEHNVATDPEAAAVVFSSGIPITLVGLNVTRKVVLTREQAEILRDKSPLGDFLHAMTDQWLVEVKKRDWTCMHDPLAVAALVAPAVIKTRPLHGSVLIEGEASGKVAWSSEGEPKIDVAVDVDAARFDELFQARITSAVYAAAG